MAYPVWLTILVNFHFANDEVRNFHFLLILSNKISDQPTFTSHTADNEQYDLLLLPNITEALPVHPACLTKCTDFRACQLYIIQL